MPSPKGGGCLGGLATAEGGNHDAIDIESLFAFYPSDGTASRAFSEISPSHRDVGLDVGDREPRSRGKEFSVAVDATDGDAQSASLFLIPRDDRTKGGDLEGGGAAAFVAEGLACADGAALSVEALCVESAGWVAVEVGPQQEVAVVVARDGGVGRSDPCVGDIEEGVGGFALVVEESEFEFSLGSAPRNGDLVSAESHGGERRVLRKQRVFGLDGGDLALGFEIGVKELEAYVSARFVEVADPANA